MTEEEGLDVKEVDKVIQESGTVPMGPFFLTDLLGLDTVLHVAEHLHESYGDRFYVSPEMKELVEAGQPRRRRPERASMSTATAVGGSARSSSGWA